MLLTPIREVAKLEWAQLRARRALPCMLAIAVCLSAGLLAGQPQAGMVAASGAFSVGLGSFQWLGQSRIAPMLLAALGMAVSASGGSLVGHSLPGALGNAAWAGFGSGMLVALGPGVAWVGLQCGIMAVVASGYPVGLEAALSRAAAILVGGLLQTAIMVAVWWWRSPDDTPAQPDPYEGIAASVRILWANLTPRSETFLYAVRLSLTLTVAAATARLLGLANGYWVPMTALLVLKRDFQGTFVRGLERLLGTLAGAALATLLVHVLHLGLPMIGVLIVLFAWLGYALVNVNYGVYAVFLTAYIVFLLDFGGLSTHAVVTHRALNTALGGGLALLSYTTTLLVRRWRGGGGTLLAAGGPPPTVARTPL